MRQLRCRSIVGSAGRSLDETDSERGGYLVRQGTYLKTVVLVGGGVSMAVMDDLVRTILVGDRSHFHTVLVFFSVLGGLQIFGLIGIVAVPLVVAMGVTLVEG